MELNNNQLTELKKLFYEMLANPNAPKPYRRIRDFYEKHSLDVQKNVFQILIKKEFNE